MSEGGGSRVAGMTGRGRVWIGGGIALAGLVGLAAYLVSVGLDKADKWASVIGVFVALISLGVAVHSITTNGHGPGENDGGSNDDNPGIAPTVASPTEGATPGKPGFPPAPLGGKTEEASKLFEKSWTGDEDPREFTKYDESLLNVAFVGGLAFLLFVAAFFIPGRENHRWAEAFMLGVAALVALGACDLSEGWRSRWTLRRSLFDRTLRIDDEGITTIDSSGTQQIRWDAIVGIALRDADKAACEHFLLALHVQISKPKPGASTVLHRPAGWPINADFPDVCRGPRPPDKDAWIPVCVLGPLDEAQGVDLQNTIATYNKGRPLEMEGNC
ncbi:hypothetical protein AB0L06_30645 [Spirillospora sp. NPDC052269]